MAKLIGAFTQNQLEQRGVIEGVETINNTIKHEIRLKPNRH